VRFIGNSVVNDAPFYTGHRHHRAHLAFVPCWWHPPIVVIYLMADVGSVGGGWLSSMLIRRGWTVNATPNIATLICACAVVPIVLAPRVAGEWTGIALIGLAAASPESPNDQLAGCYFAMPPWCAQPVFAD
jgi:hypothetical protein